MTAATRAAVPDRARTYLPDADYADCFRIAAASPFPAATTVRHGLEGMPVPARAFISTVHRQVLGLRLAPPGTPGHVFGWAVEVSEPQLVVLSAQSWLIDARLVLETADTDTTLTTLLRYRQPVARGVWAVVGIAHRRAAPQLLARTGRRDTSVGPSGY